MWVVDASRAVRVGAPSVALSLTLFASGCTHVYRPALDPRDSRIPAEWRIDSAIAVVNDETNTEKFEILDYGLEVYLADRATLSEAATQLMRHLLTTHGMPVDGPASKALRVRVVEGVVEKGVWTGYCALTLEVDTPSGLHEVFEGDAHSGDELRACSRSLARAVGYALLDPEISTYLRD